jgi:hypothetical protein
MARLFVYVTPIIKVELNGSTKNMQSKIFGGVTQSGTTDYPTIMTAGNHTTSQPLSIRDIMNGYLQVNILLGISLFVSW